MQNAFVDATPIVNGVDKYCSQAQRLLQVVSTPNRSVPERYAELLEAMQLLERQFADLQQEIQSQDHLLAMMHEVESRGPAAGALMRPTGYTSELQDAADIAVVAAQDDLARAQARTSRYPQVYSLLTAQRFDPVLGRLQDATLPPTSALGNTTKATATGHITDADGATSASQPSIAAGMHVRTESGQY